MQNYSIVYVDLQLEQMNYCGDMEDLYVNLLNREEISKENIILENKSRKPLSKLSQVEKVYLKIIVEKLREEYKGNIGLKIIKESINDIIDIISLLRIDFIVLNIDIYEDKDIKKLKEDVKVVDLYNL